MAVIKISFIKKDIDYYYMMKERKKERREFVINIKNYLLMLRRKLNEEI